MSNYWNLIFIGSFLCIGIDCVNVFDYENGTIEFSYSEGDNKWFEGIYAKNPSVTQAKDLSGTPFVCKLGEVDEDDVFMKVLSIKPKGKNNNWIETDKAELKQLHWFAYIDKNEEDLKKNWDKIYESWSNGEDSLRYISGILKGKIKPEEKSKTAQAHKTPKPSETPKTTETHKAPKPAGALKPAGAPKTAESHKAPKPAEAPKTPESDNCVFFVFASDPPKEKK